MKNPAAPLSTLVAVHLMFAASAVAAVDDQSRDAVDNDRTTISAAPGLPPVSPHSWEVRLEGSLVGMKDAWLSLPAPELGLTLGADVSRSWSIELTGSAREPGSEARHSWSALAAARWVALSSLNGRHRLTLAGGPFLEVNNIVHGTMAFAHAEVAYVYRAPFGLTVLAGFGPNIALTNSSYVAPPKVPCDDNQGDAIVFCFDLGPDAAEIHVGDALGQMRLAVGWQF